MQFNQCIYSCISNVLPIKLYSSLLAFSLKSVLKSIVSKGFGVKMFIYRLFSMADFCAAGTQTDYIIKQKLVSIKNFLRSLYRNPICCKAKHEVHTRFHVEISHDSKKLSTNKNMKSEV